VKDERGTGKERRARGGGEEMQGGREGAGESQRDKATADGGRNKGVDAERWMWE
jgi:hypothetical protein